MSKERTKKIREFILDNIEKNPNTVVRVATDIFSISRQAINKHLRKLIKEGVLEASGTTRNRTYKLKPITDKTLNIPITADLAEHEVWNEHVSNLLTSLPKNVLDICNYGFTEIFNNVLDHSEASGAVLQIHRTITTVDIWVIDNGVGIFNKIKNALGLKDHRQAILELAKGKLTTDPERHTGEGIFFTTRMFDMCTILSGSLGYIHDGLDDGWLIETHKSERKGTSVHMQISSKCTRTEKEIFDTYAPEFENNGFSKTHVPINLFRMGNEKLISRSQAKRVLARFENFKEVFLDFEGVSSIGQAFADEIFRVFPKQNPEIHLTWINANEEVERIIKRVSGQLNNSSDK